MDDNDIITVLNKRVKLAQIEGGFKSSIDALLLAAACPVSGGQMVLDMGCGVGTAGLCVLERVAGASLCGVDVQGDHVLMAQSNAELNGMDDRAEFICSDIREFDGGRYDHVICNPPYLNDGDHVKSPSSSKALAMGADVELNDWVACAFDHIKGRGSLTFIHRADKVDHIIQAFGKSFGGVEIFPLWPRAGVNAKRVIVRGWKHKRSGAIIHSGLVLHDIDGSYTKDTEKILRDAEALL